MKLILASMMMAACTINGVQVNPTGGGGDDGNGSATSTGNGSGIGNSGSGSDSDIGSDAGYDANCNATEGPEHPYTTVAELDQLVLGKWIHCFGPSILGEEFGLSFDADGTYHALGFGEAGMVELNGFGNQGTWDGSQETATSVQWNIHPMPNSGTGGYPTFEDGPRMFAFALEDANDFSVYAIAFEP